MKNFRTPKLIKEMSHSPTALTGAAILFAVFAMAVAGLIVAPDDAQRVFLENRLLPPGPGHILGCDLYGRDLLISILSGAGLSLYIAFSCVLITSTVGIALGLVAGYHRGTTDAIIMRIVDILMAFPGILLTMALASLSGPGINTIIFAISATGWTGMARIVRGQVLSIRERDYIHATKALGSDHLRILLYHILPPILPPAIITATFSLSSVILAEASLSFLGIGVMDSLPTWGSLLNQGRTVLTRAPHLCIAPGLMILLLILAFNFLGDALRDALDPKTKD